MIENPRSFNNPGRKMLDETDINGLGHAIYSLTHEIWILTDRLAILEAVLDKHGISVSEEIDQFQPDESLQEKLDERGRALTSRVINAIAGTVNNATE